ncbi:MAG: xylose isomerase [Verrucomicrobia bacterium]|nr:xylose isomerase [Verrucomicrobiota bacterium]
MSAVPHLRRTVPARELWLFATLWSLRQYPTQAREWSWAKKFAAIRHARFDGVFSPPIPALADRGELKYLAVTSLDALGKIAPALRAAKALGALAIDVQLGDFDSPVSEMVKLAVRIREVARDLELPFAIETHRDTFTETPEATVALSRGYRKKTGEILPLCLDHSHFAVIRHLAPPTFWKRLSEPAELLRAATQFHLRPFNGHHCQIPVLDSARRRTPEYRDWLRYSDSLLHFLRAQKNRSPVLAVPEIGHAAPAYGLSCFGDTWRDVQTVEHDLRRQWRGAP